MDRILKIRKKENGPRASSAPALELNTIIFIHVYWYIQQISGERLQDHWSSGYDFWVTKRWHGQIFRERNPKAQFSRGSAPNLLVECLQEPLMCRNMSLRKTHEPVHEKTNNLSL